MTSPGFFPSPPLLKCRRALISPQNISSFCFSRSPLFSTGSRPPVVALSSRNTHKESADRWEGAYKEEHGKGGKDPTQQYSAIGGSHDGRDAGQNFGGYERTAKDQYRELDGNYEDSDAEEAQSETKTAEELTRQKELDSVTSTYLQCPECSAMYIVDLEEVKGVTRIVRCFACRHEWFAGEKHILWGDEAAASALRKTNRTREGPRTQPESKEGPSREESLPSSFSPRVVKRFAKETGSGVFDGSGFAFQEGKDIDNPHQSSKGKSSETAQVPISIFVGNLSFQATHDDLMDLFGSFGRVTSCNIPCTASGSSKGYGFIGMARLDEGRKAIQALQGHIYFGRAITVQEAVRRDSSYSFPKGVKPNIARPAHKTYSNDAPLQRKSSTSLEHQFEERPEQTKEGNELADINGSSSPAAPTCSSGDNVKGRKKRVTGSGISSQFQGRFKNRAPRVRKRGGTHNLNDRAEHPPLP